MSEKAKNKTEIAKLSQLPPKIIQFLEKEKKLAEENINLASFTKERNKFVSRYSMVEVYQELYPERFSNLDQLWQRVWAEPQDPIQLTKQYHEPTALELHQKSIALLEKLEELMEMRSRTLKSWKKMLDEVKHRSHLLMHIDSLLQPLEDELEAHIRKEEEEATKQKEAQTRKNIWEQRASQELEVPEEYFEQFDNDEYIDERRIHQRIDVGMVVEFGAGSHSFYTGFSENISSGGIFIATYTLMPELGKRFALTFSIPGHAPMTIAGEVSWIREYSEEHQDLSPGFGCRFVDLTEEEEKLINSFIQKEGSLFMPT